MPYDEVPTSIRANAAIYEKAMNAIRLNSSSQRIREQCEAEYRRGNYAASIAALERSAELFDQSSIGSLTSRMYLSMAYHQAGQQAKGKELFQSLESLLDQATDELSPTRRATTNASWNDLMIIPLVRPEAEILFSDQ